MTKHNIQLNRLDFNEPGSVDVYFILNGIDGFLHVIFRADDQGVIQPHLTAICDEIIDHINERINKAAKNDA